MLQIDTSDSILIDGRDTGLKVTQRRDGTVVYTPESVISGRKYQEHKMPHTRYSTACTASGAPGRTQFEADIYALMVAR